jgi:menaquinone-specific isochorismate synthase
MGIERLGDWEIGRLEIGDSISYRPSQLISTAVPAPHVTLEQFLSHALGQERFFWQPAGEAVAFAGFGIAADLQAWGHGRFQSIHQQAQTLFKEATIANGGQPLAAPRLFGGFAFMADFVPDNTWAGFHPAQFILPHYQLVQVNGQSWLTMNAILASEDDPADMIGQLQAALATRLALLQETVPTFPPPATPQQINYPMSFESWQTMITEATSTLRASEMNKVVLSRVCELRFQEEVPVDVALHYLNQTYPDCYRFLFEPRPYHAFYGATPELLAKVDGRNLTTTAIAGSIRRGHGPAEDAALAHELLTSPKDLYEHAVVVDSIRRRLEPVVSELTAADEPGILRLGYIHHLHTPVHGRLHHPTGILPIAEILHPTPALGGTPRDLALAFISAHEPVPRGWYAAPVGCINHHLDGVFAVGIRSAIAQDRRIWLHAGAGIVADSQPQKEWDETALKFRPMFNALGIVNYES